MFCPNCGKDVGNAKFCSECGSPVTQTTATPKPSPTVIPPSDPKPKKKSGCLPIIIIFLCLSFLVPLLSNNGGYSSIDNKQRSTEKYEQVHNYVHNILLENEYYDVTHQVEWIGYSKYKDMMSKEEYEEMQLGGYYSYVGQLINGSYVNANIYTYWEDGEEPVILNLSISGNAATNYNKIVLVEYDENKIIECWNEYQERVFG